MIFSLCRTKQNEDPMMVPSDTKQRHKGKHNRDMPFAVGEIVFVCSSSRDPAQV